METVDEFLSDRESIFAELKKKLQKAQLAMKHTPDRKCRDVHFDIGDLVMVRLQPQRQSSIIGQQRGSFKLNKRFYGPFKILDQIGPAAYKLKLPKGTRIHLVFHCSMLKPFHQPPLPDNNPPLSLPPVVIDNQPLVSPLAIVGTRHNSDFDKLRLQVLVQWDGLLPEDTTWEDWEQLQAEYHLEDKVIFEGIGDDSKQEPASTRPKRRSNAPAYLKDYI